MNDVFNNGGHSPQPYTRESLRALLQDPCTTDLHERLLHAPYMSPQNAEALERRREIAKAYANTQDTYVAVARAFGITGNRVAQLVWSYERKIRNEKIKMKRDAVDDKATLELQLELERLPEDSDAVPFLKRVKAEVSWGHRIADTIYEIIQKVAYGSERLYRMGEVYRPRPPGVTVGQIRRIKNKDFDGVYYKREAIERFRQLCPGPILTLAEAESAVQEQLARVNDLRNRLELAERKLAASTATYRDVLRSDASKKANADAQGTDGTSS